MFEKFANIFRIPDLRRRILFTLALLAVYRLGGHIPTPGINADKLQQFFEQNRGTMFGFVDLFSGGQLRRMTIFALGIMPYITASIILQLLTVIYEPLPKLQKEGELGRRKITQWTRYVTVLLGIVQSFAIALTLTNTSTGQSMVTISRGAFIPLCVITLTAGTAFIMCLGEQLTERGIGNGMSLLIFTGIVVGLPRGVHDLWDKARDAAWGPFTPISLLLLVGVMAAILGFIVFRPYDIADNMRKYGRFIPGIRPGRRTSDFINDVLTRITLVGALYLMIVWTIPTLLISGIHFNHLWLVGRAFDALPGWMVNGLGVQFYFGGTSLLIVVGVAMDTVQQIESQLIMRHYEGDRKSTRLN